MGEYGVINTILLFARIAVSSQIDNKKALLSYAEKR